MPTYLSRHNPRRQLVAQSERIGSVESYDRFYDIGFEALQRGVLPLLRLESGRLLFRYCNATIEQSRTLREAEFSTLAGQMRYSGQRLSGLEGHGALYLGSLGGILRERVHYGAGSAAGGLILPGLADRTRAAVKAMAGTAAAVPGAPQPFHVYRLKTGLLLADLRARTLVVVFQHLLAAPGARARFGLSPAATADGLMNAVLAPRDYSAARGLADAVFDAGVRQGVAGLVATSARGDSDAGLLLDNAGDGVEGLVHALFGRAGERFEVLEPVASHASFAQLRDAVKGMPGFAWLA